MVRGAQGRQIQVLSHSGEIGVERDADECGPTTAATRRVGALSPTVISQPPWPRVRQSIGQRQQQGVQADMPVMSSCLMASERFGKCFASR